MITFGRIVIALVSLVALRIMTIYLPPEQYGVLALLTSIQAFCGLVIVNPIGQYINLNTHKWFDEGSLFSRFGQYRVYLIIVSLVGVFVSMTNSTINAPMTLLSIFLIVWAGNWNSTLVPLLNMLGYRTSSVIWSIVTVVLGLIMSTLFILWEVSATNWLFGQAVGMGIGAVCARYSLKRKVKNQYIGIKVHLIDRSTVLTYCIPLAFATGAMWLAQSSYRFIIESLWGLAELGFVVVGLQVAGAMWSILETIAMQFLYPYFFRHVSDTRNENRLKQSYSDLINTLVPVYILLTGFLIVGSPFLLKVLVSEKYQSVLIFLVLGAMVELCRASGNIMSYAAQVRRKTSVLIYPYFIGAILVVVGIWIVGYLNFNIVYAGYVLLIAGISMLLSMSYFMYRQIKFTLDLKRWVFALFLFTGLSSALNFMPLHPNFLESILSLMFLGLMAALFLFLFLNKYPPLKRLLDVDLIPR